jgi:multiple antibiotic resistance protein
MWEPLLHAFLTLFVVIDPFGQIATFVALTRGHAPAEQRSQATRAVVIAAIVLFAFAFLGDAMLRALGISLPALRIAGGVLLFLLAIDMIFALESGIRTTTSQELAEAESRRDISVFPLAIPLIAGPGAFASIALIVGRQEGDPVRIAAMMAVLALVLLMTLACLLMAGTLLRWIGRTGANVISRVLGILLSALAVQFIIDGLLATELFG